MDTTNNIPESVRADDALHHLLARWCRAIRTDSDRVLIDPDTALVVIALAKSQSLVE